MSINTHWAEVRVLSDVMRHSLVAGRGSHDQQQCVSRLLSNGSISMNEGHEQGEDQQIGGALLSRRRPEQHLQNYRLPGHGHAHLPAICVVSLKSTSSFDHI